MSKRKWLIGGRWRDILLYGVISAAFFQLLKPALESITLAVRLDSPAILCAWEVITISAAVYFIKEFQLGYWKVWQRSFWAFPPLWVAAFFGLVMLTQPYKIWMYVISFVGILLIAFLIFGRIRSKPKLVAKLEDVDDLRQDIGLWSKEQVMQWVDEERPVDAENGNAMLLFGHEKHVKAIFNRLIADKNAKRSAKSLALIGVLGSGKTSIINALSLKIEEQAPSWMVVKVDAWARSPSNIDEQILELVLDRISQCVDVAGLRMLPNKYHAALESHSGWWAFLSHLASGGASTEKKLTHIDDLLLVLDRKLLIVIEDPDRGPDDSVQARRERMLSLIDRLQQFTSDRIKVIVSGGEALFDDDHRVFEYREEITSSAGEFVTVLNKFVNEVWCAVKNCPILPYGKPDFKLNDFPFGTPPPRF